MAATGWSLNRGWVTPGWREMTRRRMSFRCRHWCNSRTAPERRLKEGSRPSPPREITIERKTESSKWAVVVDPTKELDVSLKRVIAELEDLMTRRDELEQKRRSELAELDERIAKRRAYLKATTELLNDLLPPGKQVEVPAVAMPAVRQYEKPKPSLLSIVNALPKSGYGAATAAVLAMIQGQPEGCTTKEMTAVIATAKFDVQDPVIAVRSAVKNLRTQQKVKANSETGRYQAI